MNKNVFNIPVSYFSSFWSNAEHRPLKDVLSEIKGESLAQQTMHLKRLFNSKNYKSYQEKKRNLPAVTFSGVFERKRNLDSLLHYSHLCILDIDKLEERTEKVKELLQEDKYVFALWKSPSQVGLKGLVLFKYNFQVETIDLPIAHKLGFNQLRDYFKETYNVDLDAKGSDIPRLCFLSQDKDIVIKSKTISFEIQKNEKLLSKTRRSVTRLINSQNTKDALYNPKNKNDPEDRMIMRKIIKFLIKNKLSITYEYDQWLKVGFAIANSFTYDVGQKYYHELSSLDVDKYKKNECEWMLKKCYMNSKKHVTFASIMHYAKDTGFVFFKKEI